VKLGDFVVSELLKLAHGVAGVDIGEVNNDSALRLLFGRMFWSVQDKMESLCGTVWKGTFRILSKSDRERITVTLPEDKTIIITLLPEPPSAA